MKWKLRKTRNDYGSEIENEWYVNVQLETFQSLEHWYRNMHKKKIKNWGKMNSGHLMDD
jgi:hypothetical protein